MGPRFRRSDSTRRTTRATELLPERRSSRARVRNFLTRASSSPERPAKDAPSSRRLPAPAGKDPAPARKDPPQAPRPRRIRPRPRRIGPPGANHPLRVNQWLRKRPSASLPLPCWSDWSRPRGLSCFTPLTVRVLPILISPATGRLGQSAARASAAGSRAASSRRRKARRVRRRFRREAAG